MLIGTSLFLLSAFAGSAVFDHQKWRTCAQSSVRTTAHKIWVVYQTDCWQSNHAACHDSIRFVFSMSVNSYFSENNYGVEFFVESEPEQAIVYVKARGNLALNEKDAIVREVEEIVLAHPGIKSVFAFAGAGGLNANTSGAAPQKIPLAKFSWKPFRGKSGPIFRNLMVTW